MRRSRSDVQRFATLHASITLQGTRKRTHILRWPSTLLMRALAGGEHDCTSALCTSTSACDIRALAKLAAGPCSGRWRARLHMGVVDTHTHTHSTIGRRACSLLPTNTMQG